MYIHLNGTCEPVRDKIPCGVGQTSSSLSPQSFKGNVSKLRPFISVSNVEAQVGIGYEHVLSNRPLKSKVYLFPPVSEHSTTALLFIASDESTAFG